MTINLFIKIILIIIEFIYSYEKYEGYSLGDSSIILKIGEEGNCSLLYHDFKIMPIKVLINDTYIADINITNYYYNKNSIVKMIWNETLRDINNMFRECYGISEIDFSGFNSSSINNTNSMFLDCHSLTSINFSHFDTSLVTEMNHMFFGCKSLTSLDVSHFNTSLVKNMEYMFCNCHNLIYLDISNFNTKSVTNMKSMFNSCFNLASINLSNFNTSLVTNFASMFTNCSDLISLNLSNFNTSLATNFENMFDNCTNLTSLNLSKFYTSSATNFASMFHLCKNLISLDISNFDSSLVISMDSMFSECYELNSLNLSHFNTSSVKHFFYMFNKCKKLKFLNLSNFNTSFANNINHMFSDCSSLISLDISNFDSRLIYVNKTEGMFSGCENLQYLNMSGEYLNNTVFDQINVHLPNNIVYCFNDKYSNSLNGTKKNCSVLDCSINWKQSQKKLFYDNNTKCVDSCRHSYTHTFEYKDKCYDKCPSDTFYLIDDIIIIIRKFFFQKKEYGKCVPLSSKNESEYLNISCINSTEKCYKTKKGYDLVTIKNWKYNNCFSSLNISDEEWNDTYHNCSECKPEYNYILELENSNINCYSSCIYYIYYENNTNKSFCTKNDSCPSPYDKLIKPKKQCIDRCDKDNLYQYQFRNECYSECPYETIRSNKRKYFCESLCNEEEPYEIIDSQQCVNSCKINEMLKQLCILKYKFDDKNKTKALKENIINDIISEIKSGLLNEILTEMIHNKNNSQEELTIVVENEIHQIGMLSYFNERVDLSSVNFDECEKVLKQNGYQFNDTNDLIMYKIEHLIDGYKIPFMDYALFLKTGDEIIQINLDICNNTNVIHNIPISINDSDIDKYNPESDFYNDKCSKFTTDSGTDMTIYDRKNKYNANNMSVCEKGCTFIKYNSDIKRVECDCKIKSNLTYSYNNEDYSIDKLTAQKSSSNLGVTSCRLLCFKENLTSNTGFYVVLVILLILIIIFVLFYSKGYNMLEGKIDEVIRKTHKGNKKKSKNIIKQIINKNNKNKRKKPSNNIQKKDSKNILLKSNTNKAKTKNNNNNKINNILETKENKKNMSKNKNIKNSTNKALKPDTDYEYNWLSYKDATKFDKRASCEYYLSLIQNKQLFMFTFCNFNDYNSGIIKKFIFFLSFALHYTINALFFNDDTMHQIYEDEGSFNFGYQYKYILLSALVSTCLLRIILQLLVLTDKDVLEVKLQQTRTLAFKKKKQKLKCIIIKTIIFFVLNFLLLMFFWYYLTCFNAIYENTQIYLIENTLISFGFSLFYPFIINIFPTILRKYSIHSLNKTKNYLYKFSQILQLI